MKTLSKKLLTLLLACVMLVSVVPFQAMAAGETVNVPVDVYINDVLCPESQKSLAVTEGDDPIMLTAEKGERMLESMEDRTVIGWGDNAGWGPSTSGQIAYTDYAEGYRLALYIKEVPGSGNGNKPTECEHKNIKEKNVSDKDNHWDVCECDEKLNVTAHTWNAEHATTEHAKYCKVCDYVAEPKLDAPKTYECCGAEVGKAHKSDCVNYECPDCRKQINKSGVDHATDCVNYKGIKITFIDTMNDTTEYRYFKNGDLTEKAPDPTYKNHNFKGWYTGKNGTGNKLEDELDATNGPATTYYSHWNDDADKDGVSTLTIYAKLYAGGKRKDTVKLMSVDLTDGTNAFKWLDNHESDIADKIKNHADIPDHYKWGDHYYYDYSGKELLTQQDLEMDGDKSIVVKLYSENEATVLLYVHRKVSSAAERIIEMNGYVKGDVVDRDDALAAVKKYYSGSNMKLQGLYTTAAWNQLRNDEDPTAANGITVEDNGTLKIHVLLTNATSNKGEADPSNPKTGDSIFMAITVMAISASALAVAYIYNKKRMVK